MTSLRLKFIVSKTVTTHWTAAVGYFRKINKNYPSLQDTLR